MSVDKDVVRFAKQIYNHLMLRDRITLLHEHASKRPPEIQKMLILAMTDKNELRNVITRFLQWTPPGNARKTINDLIERLDQATMSFCSAALDDDTTLPRPQHANGRTAQKRLSPCEAEDLAAKRLRSDSTSSVASSGGTQLSGFGQRSSASPAPTTPPLSPFENESEDFAGVNVISSPPRKTKVFDDLPWTVQYEIARFMSTCKVPWQDLSMEVTQRFKNVARDDPRRLFHTMMRWYSSKNNTLNNDSDGLAFGLMSRPSDHVWTHLERAATGGNTENRMIHYVGVVQLYVGKPPMVQLKAPCVGASNRFFRKFGEHRFLELKLNKGAHPSLIRANREYFLKPFRLMGRTFKFLFVKADTVILFATEGAGDPVTIRQVIDWHIPILENWDMTTSKFASRMSLGYSNSIPTLVFDPNKIEYIDDLYATQGNDPEACMTDGCGLISVSAMRKIMGCQRSDELPCAIQGRIGGAKGIWIVSPDLDLDTGDWIKIRKSQHKFKTGVPQFDRSYDPMHYTFDLVKNSICIYPSNLNTQFIQCLSSGGVPTHVFIELLKEYLDRLVYIVNENRNIRILRDWIAKTGAVMKARWELEDIEKDVWREQGASDDDYIECRSNDEGFDGQEKVGKPEYWKTNAYSGHPAVLHESALRMLDSGFDLSNPYVANKVTNIFRDVMRSITTKYKIEVQQSCTVTCVPDPTGILEEGQVFLQLSNRRIDEKTGIRAGLVVGSVIVTRNPCGLKSDVQKVQAVDCPELRIYTDIIVFSVKGKRSLASMLGGGDYDGDIVFCCWDSRIVDPFTSSPVPDEPPRIKDAFEKNLTNMGQALARHRDLASQEVALQQSFLDVSLPDSTLGQYENWRTVLAEMTSMENEDVIYLAHMCAKLVDAPKQGLRLKDTVLWQDRASFSKTPHPAWFLDKKNKQREKHFKAYTEVNQGVIPSERSLVTAMDYLYDALLKETDAFTKYSRSMFDDDDVKFKDPDLILPWNNAMELASELGDSDLLNDLSALQKEVDKNFDEYNRSVKELVLRRQCKTDSRYDPSRPTAPFLADYSTYNTLFELEEYIAQEYSKIPQSITSTTFKIDAHANQGKMLELIKASYAYIRTVKNEKYSKYCYIVAYDAIRRIKADARTKSTKPNGMSEPVVPYMYTAMSMDRSWLRKLKETKHVADYGIAHVRLANSMLDDKESLADETSSLT